MSLPWSARQMEWLRAMGFDVLVQRSPSAPAAPMSAAEMGAELRIPAALLRAARGIDLAPLLGDGAPRDIAARRALWRALRPLRKAARTP